MKKKEFINVENDNNERRGIIMAVMARPRGSSYVVKNSSAKKIVENKATPAQSAKIKNRAIAFQKNNLKQK